MHYRRLGRTGFEVSQVGHGAWGLGGGQWLGGSDEESVAALKASMVAGVNFIDTALAYGAEDGHSEKLVALAVSEAGDEVFIATKVPPKNRIWPARSATGIEDVFPYDYIIQCTETSLRNLNVPVIDLQQLHVWNPEWIDRDEWKRAIEDLKQSGKVRAFGISINDHQPDSAIGIINTGLIDTVQVIYNIFDQSAAKTLFPLCVEKDIGVIARVPFDEGALTGRVTPKSTFEANDFRATYFRGDRLAEVEQHVEALVADLGIHREGLATAALRFVISEPAVATVIPGMRSLSSVDANVRAPMLGPLPEAELEIARRHAWDKNYYS